MQSMTGLPVEILKTVWELGEELLVFQPV